MTKEPVIRYVTNCPICGMPIYPFPADHEGHCHIVHKTLKERIDDLEQRVTSLEEEE